MLRRLADRLRPWRAPIAPTDAPSVVVIGAGAAGLASAVMLRRHGYRALIIAAETEVGGSWPQRYDALQLNTVRWMSDLPGLRMSSGGRWPSRDAYSNYLRSYTRWHSLECHLGVQVERVTEQADRWLVQLCDEREPIVVDGVVVATGAARQPHVPDWEGLSEFGGTVLHSNRYRNPDATPPGTVLVVGGGSSGGEIVIDLVAAGRDVVWSIRTAPQVFPREYRSLPTTPFALPASRVPDSLVDRLGSRFEQLVYGQRDYLPPPPAGVGTLLKRCKEPLTADGIVELLRRRAVRVIGPVHSFDRSRVHVRDDGALAVDVVIAATGYRTGLEALLPDHRDVLTDGGRPTQLVPRRGLGFVGFRVPLAGTLSAIDADARGVANGLLV